jgi:hypothetical protein
LLGCLRHQLNTNSTLSYSTALPVKYCPPLYSAVPAHATVPTCTAQHSTEYSTVPTLPCIPPLLGLSQLPERSDTLLTLILGILGRISFANLARKDIWAITCFPPGPCQLRYGTKVVLVNGASFFPIPSPSSTTRPGQGFAHDMRTRPFSLAASRTNINRPLFRASIFQISSIVQSYLSVCLCQFRSAHHQFYLQLVR